MHLLHVRAQPKGVVTQSGSAIPATLLLPASRVCTATSKMNFAILVLFAARPAVGTVARKLAAPVYGAATSLRTMFASVASRQIHKLQVVAVLTALTKFFSAVIVCVEQAAPYA